MAHRFDLTKISTRELLGYLNRARICHSKYCNEHDNGYDPTDDGGDEIPIAELKAELATREHIPNKPEGKLLRRARAKRKT